GTYNLLVSALNLPPQKFEYINLGPGQEVPLDATLQGVMPKPAVNVPAQSAGAAEAPPAAAPAVNQEAPAAAAPAQAPAEPSAQTPAPGAGAAKGSISGVATDPTGAVIPGATVVLTRSGVVIQRTDTDQNGKYSFTGLEPGSYDLSMSAPNFTEQ